MNFKDDHKPRWNWGWIFSSARIFTRRSGTAIVVTTIIGTRIGWIMECQGRRWTFTRDRASSPPITLPNDKSAQCWDSFELSDGTHNDQRSTINRLNGTEFVKPIITCLAPSTILSGNSPLVKFSTSLSVTYDFRFKGFCFLAGWGMCGKYFQSYWLIL